MHSESSVGLYSVEKPGIIPDKLTDSVGVVGGDLQLKED